MIDNETIKKARQTDLAEYLLSIGVPLEAQGNRHRHKEHDSLVFTGNSYYWNSRGGESGNAVDYLTRHMNMSFKDAINALIQCPTISNSERHSIFNEKLSLNADCAKVIMYLKKARNIGLSVIDYLVGEKLLFQEKQTNNAVFPMYDENKNLVGAELQGILPDKRFKGIKANSKYGYGFNVRFSDDNTFEYALFFESAVDLISFIDWKLNHEKKSLDRCILISMAGLKENIISHTLKAFKGNLKPVLCIDNDEAGEAFKNKLKQKETLFSVRTPDEAFKDWNEQLTEWRKNKPIQRLINNSKILT